MVNPLLYGGTALSTQTPLFERRRCWRPGPGLTSLHVAAKAVSDLLRGI